MPSKYFREIDGIKQWSNIQKMVIIAIPIQLQIRFDRASARLYGCVCVCVLAFFMEKFMDSL